MAYVPPPPGSTEAGQPTPQGVPKQDVHITDLPPEVRKSFLLSMIFFPSLVGAAICVLMFLGWVTIFKQKESLQYAKELGSPDMRRRWTAAREMSEHITHYGEEGNARIYAPETLAALLAILDDPDLDKERMTWSPSEFIKQDKEKISIRWWAAYMTGHIAAKLPASPEKEKAFKTLLQLLEEKDIAIYAASGLALMPDARAGEPLTRNLENNPDPGVRSACAKALGTIGEYFTSDASMINDADRFRGYLRNAFQLENGKPKRDEYVLANLAVALAHMRDSAGLAKLKELESDEDSEVRRIARKAIEILNTPPQK